ncbi:MAG TPA: hypothetical protein VEW95_13925 [Candidatus Limnocylindrales bacterium]|nr:hypothetical protein [Candidatus Limnocylindrales bacterium]
MRAAAIVSGAVIAVGVYLAVAAMLSVSTSWMALGVLVIAIVAALGVMASERPASMHRDGVA